MNYVLITISQPKKSYEDGTLPEYRVMLLESEETVMSKCMAALLTK